MSNTLQNIDTLNNIIRNRRSVYPPQYSDEIIEDAIVEQILENANWAPTHGRTEPWRFTVFTGEGLRKLAEFQSDLYKKVTPVEKYDENKFVKLREKPLKASHIIAIGMKRQASGRIPEIEEVEAVACAVQNMALTATAYGLGSYWGSGGITYLDEAKSFFGLEPKDKLLGFFFLGHIAKPSPDGSRQLISDKVNWVKS